MAKLAAHGTEVARLDVTRTMPEVEYRLVLSFRSDGHILRRIDTQRYENSYSGGAWKLYKRVRKPKVSYTDAMLKLAEHFRAQHEAAPESTINAYTLAV